MGRAGSPHSHRPRAQALNCVLLEPSEPSGNQRARLTDARARHIRRVLRKSVGDTLRIGLVDGPLGTGRVVAIDDNAVEIDCAWEDAPPVRPPHELILALPRPKVLRRLWAQFAAMGLRRIHLVNAARVERCYFDSHVVEESTYRPLLIEGLRQAVDTRLPVVSVHRFFRPFVEDLPPDGPRRVCLDPVAADQPLDAAGPTLLAIGPEGGWVDFERDLLRVQGFSFRDLGPRVLRTDTACVAALARLGQ